MPSESSVAQVRAVNLGCWLVVEKWIHPSLFDGIPNKDFLDGTQLQFKSVKTKKYLSAALGGGYTILADKDKASKNETFKLWRINATQFNLRVANKQFVELSNALLDNWITATETEPKETAIFEIHRNPKDLNRVRIKASNGCFLQVLSEYIVTADYEEGDCDDEWGDNDPSVFLMTIIDTDLHGEYQLVNGYGPKLAPEVMKKHWETFIVEEDFKFIKENGLNTVRIPVGWWTAKDPNPPKPYVAGSLQFLDKAFDWAEKYGLKVIVDLHAAPGSQSGWEPSSSRDGEQDWIQDLPFMPWLKPFICSDDEQDCDPDSSLLPLINLLFGRDGFFEWASNEDHIQQSVDAIEFFAARYAKRPSLLGVELLNEPRKPGVGLDVLIDYYKRGYAAVRKHSPDAWVVMCDRLGPLGVQDPSELLSLTKELPGSVIDVHYYSVFEPKFQEMTAEQHIDYIKENRANELKKLRDRGALMFIGEWAAVWQLKGVPEKDHKKFAEAQLQVYDSGTFGWGYWSLKNKNDDKYRHWSLEWMINNGYIKLPPLK